MTTAKKEVTDVYFNSDRSEMLRYIKRSSIRVLDVGCGTGNFGSLLMREKMAEVWGIEIDHEVSKIAGEKLHFVAFGDAAEQIPKLPDNTFDLICFNDSLEHLAWPSTILEICRSKLRQGGEILCSVPNLRYFRVMFDLVFRKKFEYAAAGILDQTHLRFFTMSSIAGLFTNCGYEVLLLEGNQAHAKNHTKSWKYKIFQMMTLGRARDMLHSQIFVLARKTSC